MRPHFSLESRPIRPKNPKLLFFCPLCRTQRGLRYLPKLSQTQILRVILTSCALFALTFQFMGLRAFVWFFVVWAFVECTNKFLYRKELGCPHCGFDATWYKRDVRVAKRIVEDFWQSKGSHQDQEKSKLSTKEGEEISDQREDSLPYSEPALVPDEQDTEISPYLT